MREREREREGGRESKKAIRQSDTRESNEQCGRKRHNFDIHDVGKTGSRRQQGLGRKGNTILVGCLLITPSVFFPYPFQIGGTSWRLTLLPVRGGRAFCVDVARKKPFVPKSLWLNCRLLPLVRCFGAVCRSSDFHVSLPDMREARLG